MRLLVTGSGGLVGSEAVLHFINKGYTVYGIDNDTRRMLFGPEASVRSRIHSLQQEVKYKHIEVDLISKEAIDAAIRVARPDVVIHTAAQPSHDWAVNDPHFDFNVNALGTLHLLEATRQYNPNTPFIYTSTNKVYGDTPNKLPFIEQATRWALPVEHKWALGIDESMSIDNSIHSLFGVSKLSGDLLVQEYGKYFSMPTVAFRCGCITGPSHEGAELHGFLSYLMRCVLSGRKYIVNGYLGKQVRDNIHANDLVTAFERYIENPTKGGVYNMGGGFKNSISMLEAIEMSEHISGRKLDWEYSPIARVGDHQWWISATDKFQRDYNWRCKYSVKEILEEIHDIKL